MPRLLWRAITPIAVTFNLLPRRFFFFEQGFDRAEPCLRIAGFGHEAVCIGIEGVGFFADPLIPQPSFERFDWEGHVVQWHKKFTVAISGIGSSIRVHKSFWVHSVASCLAFVLAICFQFEAWRWVALVTAITIVWTAELLNTAIEELVRAVYPEHDPNIGRSLDVAAGAVLIASLGAAVIGVIIFGPPIWDWVMVAD